MSTSANGQPGPVTRRRRVDPETLARLGVRLDSEDATVASRNDQDRLRRALLALLLMRDVWLLAMLMLAGDIGAALGTSPVGVGFAAVLHVMLAPAIAFAGAARVRRADLRLMVLLGGSLVGGLLLVLTAVAPGSGTLMLLGLAMAIALGPLDSLAVPMLAELDDGEAASSTVVAHAWGHRLGGGATALVVTGLLTGPLGLTWRAAVALLAVVGLAVSAWGATVIWPAARSLKDPSAGGDGGDGGDGDDAGALHGFERVRQVMLIASARRAVTGFGLIGLFGAPYVVYVLAVLERDLGLAFATRGLVLGLFVLVGAGGAVVVALRMPQSAAHAATSGRLVAFSALTLLLAPVVGGNVGMVLPGVAGAFVLASGAIVAARAIVAVAPQASRPMALAMAALFMGPVGVLGGLLLVSSIDRRFGPGAALATCAGPAWLIARTAAALAAHLDHDIERSSASQRDEAELVVRKRTGQHVPMLTCHGVDFSYGQLQVLFGVDFSVDDGEIVALLGTNGAGKSTLLRVISGLGLPSSGRVHFGGSDITYLDAERRVMRGITQIPGGRAVFGPMSVVDNLRVFGHAVGRDPAALERGIDATFTAFPRLHERRNQLASTLSGGEQQMLALGKALIIKPRLLLIDELSLGLAPIIVGQLLDMVREINGQGTAVVLVEQSVNVALSLVDHAYFMEKGAIRFDGRAADLLDRRDLLRSVFLEGADQGVAGS